MPVRTLLSTHFPSAARSFGARWEPVQRTCETPAMASRGLVRGGRWRRWAPVLCPRRRRQAGATSALVFVLAAFGAANDSTPAAAMTASQADAVAINALAPEAYPSSVALFGLPDALKAGNNIEAYSFSSHARYRPPELRLHAAAWLFWEDLAYRAGFAHPSVVLVVDDKTGRILWRKNVDMYPLIDGRLPPFLTGGEYLAGSFAVWSGLPVEAPGAVSASASAFAPALVSGPPSEQAHEAQAKGGPITKEDLKDECLVTLGDRGPTEKGNNLGDPEIAKNLVAMENWADDAGLATYKSPSADGAQGLLKTMWVAVVDHKCKDVLIYMSGHGMAPPAEQGHEIHLGNHPLTFTSGGTPAGGPASLRLTAWSSSAGGTVTTGSTQISPAGLEDAISTLHDGGLMTGSHGSQIKIKPHPEVHFKVKIDSCYAERFATELQKEFKIDPDEKNPKEGSPKAPITIIEYASAAWEPSLQYMPDWEVGGKKVKNPTDNPNKISEFTNANVHGLETWTREPEVGKPRTLTAGLIQAFTLGAPQDWSRTAKSSEEPPLTSPGAIGPGVRLGTPDTVTAEELKSGHPIKIKTNGEEPGTVIETTVGPVTITEGG